MRKPFLGYNSIEEFFRLAVFRWVLFGIVLVASGCWASDHVGVEMRSDIPRAHAAFPYRMKDAFYRFIIPAPPAPPVAPKPQ